MFISTYFTNKRRSLQILLYYTGTPMLATSSVCVETDGERIIVETNAKIQEWVEDEREMEREGHNTLC